MWRYIFKFACLNYSKVKCYVLSCFLCWRHFLLFTERNGTNETSQPSLCCSYSENLLVVRRYRTDEGGRRHGGGVVCASVFCPDHRNYCLTFDTKFRVPDNREESVSHRCILTSSVLRASFVHDVMWCDVMSPFNAKELLFAELRYCGFLRSWSEPLTVPFGKQILQFEVWICSLDIHKGC